MAPYPVVVTGLGVVCAIGRNVDEFWSSLMGGRSGLAELTKAPFTTFDARVAGTVPDEWLSSTLAETDRGPDRTAELATVAAREAFRHAGLNLAEIDPERVGLVLGKCQSTASEDGGYQPIHRTADVVAGRIGAAGPRLLLSTACAAGGNCIGLARDKILTGEADIVFAGGVDPLQFGTYSGFTGLHALSPDACRPYSASTGLNLGEGSAFLVIESLDSAIGRGATPLATIAGYGLSADAYHATAPDPTGRGGTSAVRRALADAGLEPGDVDYVSGHGTGTPANDAMERKVMRNVFGGLADTVPISGIKSFFGHTLGAAGAIEGVASVLAIMHQTAPPTIGFGDESIDLGLDFVANRAREMKIDTIVSNNYAFGGNNVSVVLRSPESDPSGTLMPERDVVVTGLGPVTGVGVGIEDFARSVRESVTSPGADPSLGERTYAPRSMWRQANNLSKLAIAASRLAWEDADLSLKRAELENVGVMYATASGSQESVGSYDRSVLDNPNSPAVLSFSNVVLNATGGAVCQALGFRGPTTTICNGSASATLALECAVETIRMGKAEVVFVVAADEKGNTSESGAERAVQSSAATAFVLESANHAQARGAKSYARIVSSLHVGEIAGQDEHSEIERTIRGMNLAAVDMVFAEHRHDALGLNAASTPHSTTTMTGHCGAVSAALDIVAAADAIARGSASSVLVHTNEPGSVRGSVLLEKS